MFLCTNRINAYKHIHTLTNTWGIKHWLCVGPSTLITRWMIVRYDINFNADVIYVDNFKWNIIITKLNTFKHKGIFRGQTTSNWIHSMIYSPYTHKQWHDILWHALKYCLWRLFKSLICSMCKIFWYTHFFFLSLHAVNRRKTEELA